MFGFTKTPFLLWVLLKIKPKNIFSALKSRIRKLAITTRTFIRYFFIVASLHPCFADTVKTEIKVHHYKKIVVKKTVTESSTKGFEKSSFKFITTIEQRLVRFIHNMISTLNYNSYKLGGTRFDPIRGIYVLDCSSYVDFVLKTLYPHAYSNLVNYSSSQKPTSHDYYHFFTNMVDEPQNYWSTIDDVEQLRPGDILVFRYRNSKHERVGHVMIVMETPIRDKDTFFLRIADSAPHRHSRDTRLPQDSGIGIGTLLIKVNPKTAQPSAYAWKIGSPWRRHVNFAMARPFTVPS